MLYYDNYQVAELTIINLKLKSYLTRFNTVIMTVHKEFILSIFP